MLWCCAGRYRYRYRLRPSPGQQQALARVFGCTRVVFNDSLRLREQCRAAGEKISDSEIQRRVITLAKATPEREWLAEVPSVALVQAGQRCPPRLPELVRFPVGPTEGSPDRAPEAAPQARSPVHPAHAQRVQPAR
jgi:hypothetical protein